MNHRENDASFFEEQLHEAKNALFVANSIKRIKFLQNKIKYLKQQMKESKK